MEDEEILSRQWKEFLTRDGDAEFIRPDKLWAHLSTLKNCVTGQPKFLRLDLKLFSSYYLIYDADIDPRKQDKLEEEFSPC